MTHLSRLQTLITLFAYQEETYAVTYNDQNDKGNNICIEALINSIVIDTI